jgi:hypothetical protein
MRMRVRKIFTGNEGTKLISQEAYYNLFLSCKLKIGRTKLYFAYLLTYLSFGDILIQCVREGC